MLLRVIAFENLIFVIVLNAYVWGYHFSSLFNVEKKDTREGSCSKVITKGRNFSSGVGAGYAKSVLETIRRLRRASASGMQQVQRVRECI